MLVSPVGFTARGVSEMFLPPAPASHRRGQRMDGDVALTRTEKEQQQQRRSDHISDGLAGLLFSPGSVCGDCGAGF